MVLATKNIVLISSDVPKSSVTNSVKTRLTKAKQKTTKQPKTNYNSGKENTSLTSMEPLISLSLC